MSWVVDAVDRSNQARAHACAKDGAGCIRGPPTGPRGVAQDCSSAPARLYSACEPMPPRHASPYTRDSGGGAHQREGGDRHSVGDALRPRHQHQRDGAAHEA